MKRLAIRWTASPATLPTARLVDAPQRRAPRDADGRERPLHLAEERSEVGGHFTRPRTCGGHVDKTKQRGLQRRVAREQLHPAVLQRARAAAARGGLAGGDPAAELAHAQLAVRQAGGAPGAGGASILIRVATLWPGEFRHHRHPSGVPSTVVQCWLRSMRAIEFHGEERLELVERPDPTPGEGELLIAPTAVGICGTDVEIFDGSLAYFRMGIARYPIVPGHEWTGEVVDVGRGRDRLLRRRPGRGGGRDRLRRLRALRRRPPAPVRAADRDRDRAHGRRDGLADASSRPPSRTASSCEPRAAALVEPTSVALHGVRRGRVGGQRVLVVGAGPIGLLAAQCARAEGAASVAISDTRADRLTLAGHARVRARFAGRRRPRT